MGADGRPGVRLHAGECGSRRCGVAFRRKEDGAEPPARRRRCPMGADGRRMSGRTRVNAEAADAGWRFVARRTVPNRLHGGGDARWAQTGDRVSGRMRGGVGTFGKRMENRCRKKGARYPLRRRRRGRDFVRGARGRNKDCECARSKIERRRQFPIYINDIAKQKPR